jgi:hypothetical protein
MKRLKQANNENIREILEQLNALPDGTIIKVHDSFTGENAEGEVQNIYQWIINLNNNFDNKCKFELI